MNLAAWTRLDGLPGGVDPARLPRALTASETERARAFANPRRRAQYLAGHGLLRLVASSLTGADPESIDLPAEGRPDPAAGSGAPWLSLAHSGPFVFAIGSNRGPVGIDVEKADQERDWAALAAMLGWKATPPLDKRRFLEAWTLREAVFKSGLPEGRGMVRREETGEFLVAIVTMDGMEVAWLQPGGPGPGNACSAP